MAVFLITLHHVWRGSRHTFILALIMLFVVSDVCAWLSNAFARVWIADYQLIVPWLFFVSIDVVCKRCNLQFGALGFCILLLVDLY